MTYNFRHDRSRTPEILARIDRDKQISQGWGGGEGANLDLRKDDFVAKTVAHYNLRTTRIPSNLTRMREFKDGDILVVPRIPEYGTVSVHIVDGDFPDCYGYDVSDDTHQNHRIALKEVKSHCQLKLIGLRGLLMRFVERIDGLRDSGHF